jgi:hypothetical protein
MKAGFRDEKGTRHVRFSGHRVETHSLTPEQVKTFWAALDKWQGHLSLTHWRIIKSPHRSKAMAEMNKWDFGQRQVSCRLGLNWGILPITEQMIEQTAVHELLHVLVAPLIQAAKAGDDDAVASEEHAVINTLERLLAPGE